MIRGTYALILIASFWCAPALAVNCGTRVPGQFRFNVTTSNLEYCVGPNWASSKVSSTGITCGGADLGRVRYYNSEIGFCDGGYWYSTKGAQLTTCTATDVGKVSWNGTVLRFCDGTNWYSMTSATTTSGAFVLTGRTFTGALGGLSGAASICFGELDSLDWLGKLSQGVISPHRVTAWLCDGTSCNNPVASTNYRFAWAGNQSGGGASFTSDASGLGPNNPTNWNTGVYQTTGTIWSGRGTNTSTAWGNTSDAATCTGWTSASSGVTGRAGTLGSSTATRWSSTSPACNTKRYVACLLSPQDTQVPDPYAFNDVTAATASTVYTSNIVALTGFTGSPRVSIYSAAGGSFRICADATCSANPAWGSTTTTISAGQFLQLRVTSGAQTGSIASVTAYVGNSKASWNVSVSGLAGYFLLAYNEPTTGQIYSLAGMSGANSQCFEKAVRNDWKGKAYAGTLTRDRVRAFLCDDQACDNLQPNTTYYFAAMNSTTTGGASFTTNASGAGPGESTADWTTATYLGTSNNFPTNRGAGTATYWGLNPRAKQGFTCRNFTSNWDTLWLGYPGNAGFERWSNTNGGATAGFCNQFMQILCFVDPVLAPATLSFAALANLDPSTTYTSSIVSMSGLGSAASVTIRGPGSPQYRVCADANCTSTAVGWTSGGGPISPGQFLQLRATTSSLPGTKYTVNVRVGTKSADWILTTEGTTRTGYFVMTSSTHDGNFGGRAGAHAFCLSELSGGTWLGKTSAPALTASNTFAWITDYVGDGYSAMPLPLTTYAFARVGSASAGGATFTSDVAGNFPGDKAQWNGAAYFGTTQNYYTGVNPQTSETFTAVDADANQCNNWTDNTTSYSGSAGGSQYNDNARFSWGSANCDSTFRLLCFVHPGSSASAFGFTDQTGVTVSSTITSNVVQITGQPYEAAASASGTGSQVRVCADSGCASVVRDWRSAAFITSGQYLQVRATSAATQATARAITVSVGSTTTTWTTTTGSPGALEIASVTPSAGVATGGGTITINGANFVAGMTAKIGTLTCTSPTVVNATTLTCVVPSAGAGVFSQVDVSVTAPGPVTATLTGGYYYIGAPKAWLRADAGITQSGGLVSAWNDQSGTNHATQATSALQPAIIASSARFNGKPVVRFSGGQVLKFTNMAALRNVSGASLVVALVSDTTAESYWFSYIYPSGNDILFAGIPAGGGAQDLSSAPGDIGAGGTRTDTSPWWYSGGTLDLGMPFVASAVANYTGTTLTHYKDGVQLATSNSFASAGNTDNVNAGFGVLGAGNDVPTVAITGDIAEFFLYSSALTNAQRLVVETYMRSRYNTP